MKKYGLIGFPLKHSFSQRFFTDKFAKEGIDAAYLNFEIPAVEQFIDIVKVNPDLVGLNVTIPYKEQVIQYLDIIHKEAGEIGAVNVIKIDRTGDIITLTGYNSDIIGFQNSIAPMIDTAIHHKALILGTGGASKAVKRGLQNLGVESVFVSRTAKSGILSYEDLTEDVMKQYTVIINSSPLGTFPDIDECPHIPYHLVTPRHLLYDLVYNPAETKFLRLGREQGAKVKNGAEMLELQAISAWGIWNK